MKKLVITLGVLLMVSSGMAYAGGCCGGGATNYGASCCGGANAPRADYGNASCCSFNASTPLIVKAASCCAPGGSNFSQRNGNPAPMSPQGSLRN